MAFLFPKRSLILGILLCHAASEAADRGRWNADDEALLTVTQLEAVENLRGRVQRKLDITVDPPTGYVSTGEAPTGFMPTAEASMRFAPTGEAPTVFMPIGEAPTRSAPTGEASTRFAPTGEASTRFAPTGEAPTGDLPTAETSASGLVLVDTKGNGNRYSDNAPLFRNFQSRIVGGTPADTNEFKFIASLNVGCGGSLIAPDIILTAAHCFGNIRTARIGSNKAKSGGVVRRVTTECVHPNYQSSTTTNDYMLLKLDSSVDINQYPPIQLNDKRAAPQTNEILTVIGYGATGEGGSSSNTLLKVSVPANSHKQCNQQYGGSIVEDVMFCAGNKSGGKDSCQGDSGGPIFQIRGGKAVQVGVVSFGEGCARPNRSGVYSRVSGAYEWIQTTMEKLNNGDTSGCRNGTPSPPSTPPGNVPTNRPSQTNPPSASPTLEPTASPTLEPTASPTLEPIASPTPKPTASPIESSISPANVESPTSDDDDDKFDDDDAFDDDDNFDDDDKFNDDDGTDDDVSVWNWWTRGRL